MNCKPNKLGHNVKHIWLPVMACCLLIFSCMSVRITAKEVQVSNRAEFLQALREAVPGTSIMLSPGHYGNQITINRLYGTASEPVIIAGSDVKDMPLFEG